MRSPSKTVISGSFSDVMRRLRGDHRRCWSVRDAKTVPDVLRDVEQRSAIR